MATRQKLSAGPAVPHPAKLVSASAINAILDIPGLSCLFVDALGGFRPFCLPADSDEFKDRQQKKADKGRAKGDLGPYPR